MTTYMNTTGTCCRDGTGTCSTCGAVDHEACPLADLDPTLLDPAKAIGATTPAAECDPDEGVCEACQ